MDTNKTGFVCHDCGRHAKFSLYVFAHWHEALVHTCECGTRATIYRGAPVALIPPRAFYAAAGGMLDVFGLHYHVERGPCESDAKYRARILSKLSQTYPTKG